MGCDGVHGARLGTPTPTDDTRAANGSSMLLQPNGDLLHQHSLATFLIFAAYVAANKGVYFFPFLGATSVYKRGLKCSRSCPSCSCTLPGKDANHLVCIPGKELLCCALMVR